MLQPIEGYLCHNDNPCRSDLALTEGCPGKPVYPTFYVARLSLQGNCRVILACAQSKRLCVLCIHTAKDRRLRFCNITVAQ